MSPSRRYEARDADPSPLGKPLLFQFSRQTAPNRFLKASMSELLSSWDPNDHLSRGIPSKSLIQLYKRWGQGQFGVILSGNIMIDYDQLEAMGNAIIPLDAPFSGQRFEAFREIAAETKKHGMLLVGQVSHPGRQVDIRISATPLSASDVQLEGISLGMTFGKPRAATQEDIDRVVQGFAHAAEYLEKAGYSGIEIHGAHGYLLSQFLSPTTNRRTDKYGGSIQNRARIIVEIAEAVQKRVSKNFIMGIKLNSVEFQDKGFTPEDARKVCEILEANQFDFVELSGGTYMDPGFEHKRESTKKREAFFLEWANMITPALSQTKVYVTGGFKTVPAMLEGLKSVDGIGLARPAAQEPTLPGKILAGEVNAAINQLTDDSDFGLTKVAAGTQMRQIGKGQEPLDLSQQENLAIFDSDRSAWAQELSQDLEMKKYGFIDLTTCFKAANPSTAAPVV